MESSSDPDISTGLSIKHPIDRGIHETEGACRADSIRRISKVSFTPDEASLDTEEPVKPDLDACRTSKEDKEVEAMNEMRGTSGNEKSQDCK